MPPSNRFFQIGCFFAGSRTTMPPSADTRTLTGSVVRPIRTLGAGGADRSVPVVAGDAGAEGGRAGAVTEAAAGMTIASAAAASEVQRPDNVIRPTTLSRRRGHFPAARPR